MTSKNVCDILQILVLGMLVCEVTCFMTTFQNVSEIKNKCYVDDCDWQKYCDHQSMRCEHCSDRFLQCFTPKQDPNCTVFCMINRACPALDGLDHGDHNGTGRQFWLNEKVTFQCESGYHNTGVKETMCLSYGLWSHQQLGIKQPHCDKNICIIPQNPAHGYINFPRNVTHISARTRITYKCEDGYKLEGPDELQCQANGEWRDDPPVCVDRACPALGGLEHGDHNGTGRQFWLNEKVTFQCESGYHNTGVKETVCLSYGLWSHQQLGIKQPHCDTNMCIIPQNPAHGYINFPRNVTHISARTRITYKCEDGYKLEGPDELQCQANGEWRDDPPVCVGQQTFYWIVVVLAVVCVILLVALVALSVIACLKLIHAKEHCDYKMVDSNEADDKDVENAMEKWKLKDAQDAEQRTDSIENGPSYSLRQKQAKAVPPTTTEKTITEKTDDNDRMMSGQSTSNHQAPPVYNIYSPDTVNIGNGNNKIMPGSVLFGEDESPQSDNLNTCNTPAGEETGTSHKAQHDGEDAPFISQESNPGASSENYVKDLHV